jgi:hypothetical protein
MTTTRVKTVTTTVTTTEIKTEKIVFENVKKEPFVSNLKRKCLAENPSNSNSVNKKQKPITRITRPYDQYVKKKQYDFIGLTNFELKKKLKPLWNNIVNAKDLTEFNLYKEMARTTNETNDANNLMLLFDNVNINNDINNEIKNTGFIKQEQTSADENIGIKKNKLFKNGIFQCRENTDTDTNTNSDEDGDGDEDSDKDSDEDCDKDSEEDSDE